MDAQYYGFRDDDDGILVPLEVAVEKVGSRIIGVVLVTGVSECGSVSFDTDPDPGYEKFCHGSGSGSRPNFITFNK